MNEPKVREVLDYCYEQAHYLLSVGYFEATERDFERALENIEMKIEELTEEDLGIEDDTA